MAKSRLQEYLQKMGAPLPVYNTRLEGGTAHEPVWRSYVVIENTAHYGAAQPSKIMAEQSAASIAYAKLYLQRLPAKQPSSPHYEGNSFHPKHHESANVNRSSSLTMEDNRDEWERDFDIHPVREQERVRHQRRLTNYALLIDAENMPNFVDDVLRFIDTSEAVNITLDVLLFVGEHHPQNNRVYDPRIKKIVSPSTRKDGTDTCMQVYVGVSLAYNEYGVYLIATRDHFGASLVEMITTGGIGWMPRKSMLVTTTDHVRRALCDFV